MNGRDESGCYTSCDVCGKKFYGYDDLCVNHVDDADYCPECSLKFGFFHKGKNDRIYANKNVWRIAHTFSSMYEGSHCYVTSIDQIEKKYEILCVKHRKADPMFMNWGFGLTGHIDEEHYRVDVRSRDFGFVEKCYAFVFEPDLDELDRLKKYGIEEVKE